MNKNEFKKYIYWSDELASGLSSTSQRNFIIINIRVSV